MFLVIWSLFLLDHQLRRAIDSIPTVTEEVVIEMAREDPEMKRNIELWQVNLSRISLLI